MRNWRAKGGLALLLTLFSSGCGEANGAGNSSGTSGSGGASGDGALGGSGGSLAMTSGSGGSLPVSAGSGGDSNPAAGSGGAAGAGQAGSTGASNACSPARAHAPGDTTIDLDFGGKQRDYVLHVPTGYSGDVTVPLVVDIHGFTSWATEQLERTKWGTLADSKGFVVVEPDGFDKSWSAKVCCGTAQAQNIDDVAFIREVVKRVSAELCIDPKRIYATGHSNGAMMTFRLGCEAADLFAAIAPVAGVTPVPATCQPSRPLPVAMIRAKADSAVPYDGKGEGDARFASAAEDLAKWQAVDGCAQTPVVQSHDGVCQTYTQCTAGTQVMACSPGGGHLFFFTPADNPDNLLVPDTVWPFFEQFTLP